MIRLVNMNRILFCIAVCCTAVVGCTVSPARKGADISISGRYELLEATSIERERSFLDEILRSKMTVLRGIQARQPQVDIDSNWFDETESRMLENHDARIEFLNRIKSEINPGKDLLYYYSFVNDSSQEQGWLIKRHGKIIRTFPIGRTGEPTGKP